MRFTILIAAMLLTIISSAQKLEYNIQFHGIGDNREFSKSGYGDSKTILGERTSFELGTTVDENHQLRIGLSHLFEFGSNMDFHQPKLTAYYHFSDKNTEFYFGAFPRMNLLNFPLAFLTDTLQYYRPNVEGMYGKYTWDWGQQTGFVDWTGRQTANVREAFLAGSNGRINFNSFFFENYMVIYHLASRAILNPDIHVEDNAAFSFLLGADLKKLIPIKQAYIKVGTLGSLYKERKVMEDYIKAWSFTGELYAESKKFALKSTWSIGDGHRITMGDRFYDANTYVRTDLIWKFIDSDHVQGKFNISIHITEKEVEQSQQLSLIYRFGN